MPATKGQTYYAISGEEMGKIIQERVKAGIHQAFDLRGIRAYPLVKYKVVIELTPYQPAGAADPVPDATQKFMCEGQEFIEVTHEAVSLVEESPIIGHEVDPQQVRERAGIGSMTTKKVEGQNVDVYEKPAQEPPSFKQTPAPVTEAEARRIEQEQKETWSTINPDQEYHRALATEQEVPGRISILKK